MSAAPPLPEWMAPALDAFAGALERTTPGDYVLATRIVSGVVVTLGRSEELPNAIRAEIVAKGGNPQGGEDVPVILLDVVGRGFDYREMRRSSVS
jgi:hypothetical protein